MIDCEQKSTLLDDNDVFKNINEYYTTPIATQTEDDVESDDEVNSDVEIEYDPYLNETKEEREIRLDISYMVLNGLTVDQIEQKYPAYYSKEKMMIGFAHFFHATHNDTDYPFFSGIIHTKAVNVEDYDPLTEQDLIKKIVNILIVKNLLSTSKKDSPNTLNLIDNTSVYIKITVNQRKSLMRNSNCK
jgi:hypothetical protein